MRSTFGTCKQTYSYIILFINTLNRDGLYCTDGMEFIIEQYVFHNFIILDWPLHKFIILDWPLHEFFNPQIDIQWIVAV